MFASKIVIITAGIALIATGLAGCEVQGEWSFEATEPPASQTGLADCEAGGDVPFETIERGAALVDSPYYPPDRPSILVFTDADQANIQQWVSPDAQEILASLDYEQYMAIAVFQGWKHSSDYGVEIQHIALGCTSVNIHAYFFEPHEDGSDDETLTSPFHLVIVDRGNLQGEVAFVMNVFFVEVIRQIEIIP